MPTLQLLSPEREHRSLINQSHFHLLARDKRYQFKESQANARYQYHSPAREYMADCRKYIFFNLSLNSLQPHTLTVIAMCFKVAKQPCMQTDNIKKFNNCSKCIVVGWIVIKCLECIIYKHNLMHTVHISIIGNQYHWNRYYLWEFFFCRCHLALGKGIWGARRIYNLTPISFKPAKKIHICERKWYLLGLQN